MEIYKSKPIIGSHSSPCFCTGECKTTGVCPNQLGAPFKFDTVSVCMACGLNLHPIMGYVCARGDCPCFPKVTC